MMTARPVVAASLIGPLDRSSPEALHRQLYGRRREAVLSGRLAAGNADPSPARHSWTLDTVQPTVVSVALVGKKVSPTTKVTAAFSEEMNEASVEALGTFTLKKRKKMIPAAVVYDAANDRTILTPSRKLRRGVTYTATVTTSAKDLAGNALAVNKVWRFRVR